MVYDGGERRLLTDEGYVTFAADGTPQYHFYLRDHLGNIRVVFDQTGAVEQVTHYYPPASTPTTSGPGCISPTDCNSTNNKDVEKIGKNLLSAIGRYDKEKKQYTPLINQ